MIDFDAVVDILKQYVKQFLRLNKRVLSATSSARSGAVIRDGVSSSTAQYGGMTGSSSPVGHRQGRGGAEGGSSGSGDDGNTSSEDNSKTLKWIRHKCL